VTAPDERVTRDKDVAYKKCLRESEDELTDRVMVINTNVSAQVSARNLNESSSMLSRSLARLSSGSKIVNPQDDAAGLAVSTRFEAQISRIGAARNNLGNAVSFTQTQDGFLKKVAKSLDRMSELAIMAQDVTKSDADRALYNAEFSNLGQFVDDVATKDFNGVSLFSGSNLAVTTDADGAMVNIAGISLSSTSFTGATSATISTTTSAASALTAVKDAIGALADSRASVGANQAALNAYYENLGVLSDNLSAANSRIKDVNVAEESTAYAKYNILVQAGTAMLTQANQQPQAAIRLLG
jgi:flagellin